MATVLSPMANSFGRASQWHLIRIGGGNSSLRASQITLLQLPHYRWAKKKDTSWVVHASLPAAAMPLSSKPDHLVDSILSKVVQTDRGVLLTRDQHKKVAEVADELQQFCVDEPVNCPLIFGEWDVVYCSNPTSPGGGYRSALGRIFFKTKEMIQAVEAPDIIKNKVAFSVMGFFDGEVSLKVQYGGESEVKLKITYIDEKIRLGKGSRGSLFVFQRRKSTS
ncbi:hypothetical protein M9H77_33936 [Catharanthus roseus]|uniref:Uncharacterized protein n=1 Tax=Catharanthus roseus TaxID=4058 RepID=A0ACB9ZJQ5_CATRO|nr:hypothetical protein M9H77_33936 [Catharanthus roseus]